MTNYFTKQLWIIGFAMIGIVQLSGQELLLNTDFDNNLENWELWESDTKGSVDIDATSQLNGANSAHLKITTPGGGANWELGFAQGLPNGLSADTTYYISFQAKASESVAINVMVQEADSPWGPLYSQNPTLTTTPQTFIDSFILTSDAACNFVFQIGAIGNAEVWIDDVHLTKGAGIDNGEEPVLEAGEKMTNNFFNKQMSDWQLWDSNTKGTADIDGSGVLEGPNSAKLQITTAGGGEAWELGLAQEVVGGLEAGKSYKVSYQAVASEATTLEVVLQQPNDPWAAIYATSSELTTTAQTFIDTFEVTESTDVNWVFQYGGIENAIVWVDDVHLVELGASGTENIESSIIKISQNSPNPFVEETQIDFYLTERQIVNVSIYDITGKRIMDTGNSIYPRGNNSIKLNFVDQPNGLYFYTVQIDGYSKTMRMTLQK